MKGTVVIWLTALSVIVSTLLFYNKYNDEQSEQDLLQIGLHKLSTTTPLPTTVGYRSFTFDQAIFARSRYVLAPHRLEYHNEINQPDTVLTIQTIAGNIDMLQDFLEGRTIIYDQKDSIYQYILSVPGGR